MSRLDEATQRLQTAIDRLDRAVTARGPSAAGGDAELLAALAGAKQENAKLQAVASQASQRLDAAIGRLKDVLED